MTHILERIELSNQQQRHSQLGLPFRFIHCKVALPFHLVNLPERKHTLGNNALQLVRISIVVNELAVRGVTRRTRRWWGVRVVRGVQVVVVDLKDYVNWKSVG